MNSPGDGGGRNPFPGVNATVDEDHGLALICKVGGGNLDVFDGVTLERISRGHYCSHLGVCLANVVEVIVDLKL